MIDHFTPAVGLIGRVYKWLGYYPDPKNLSTSIRKLACGFQLKFTNYQFNSSLLHKKFKEALNSDCEPNEAYTDLNEYSAAELKVVAAQVVEGINEYFKENKKSSMPPRISLYVLKKDRSVKKLASSYETHSTNYSRKLTSDYTCFTYTCDTGLVYLDNNIPSTIFTNSDYRHDGFDLGNIRKMKQQWFRTSKIYKWIAITLRKLGYDRQDQKWSKVAGEIDNHPDCLYKSHLVIPVTFRKHADDRSLSNQLVSKLRLNDSGRSTLGLIVVDHPSAYYFDDRHPHSGDNIDINVMYLAADLLSLALVASYMYTAGSDSWLRYKEGLSD